MSGIITCYMHVVYLLVVYYSHGDSIFYDVKWQEHDIIGSVGYQKSIKNVLKVVFGFFKWWKV